MARSCGGASGSAGHAGAVEGLGLDRDWERQEAEAFMWFVVFVAQFVDREGIEGASVAGERLLSEILQKIHQFHAIDLAVRSQSVAQYRKCRRVLAGHRLFVVCHRQ